MYRPHLVSLGLVSALVTLVGATVPALAGRPGGGVGRSGGAVSRDELLLQRIEALTERVEQLEARVKSLESRPRRRVPEPQKSAYLIPLDDSPVLGPRQARVNVVIFADYQCPFCARVHPLLRQIVEDPELKGKVNVVFKHFPLSFHRDAKPAAKAALAAREQGEEYFWKMSDKLFEHQRELTPEGFRRWATEIGLDVKRFERDLEKNDARYEEIFRADMETGMKNAKVRGTPSIYVNGWYLKKRTVDAVKEIILEKGLL